MNKRLCLDDRHRCLARTVLVGLILFAAGCATTPSTPPPTKREVFAGIYNEQPHTLLVVPAINHSTAADAPLYYAASIAQPLTEQGYYVLPIPITNALLAAAGISDGTQLIAVPPQRFRAMFGADAVIFVTIDAWDTAYYVVGGQVTVGLSFRLVSTETGAVLWRFAQRQTVDTSDHSSNNSLVGLLVGLLATAIKTAQQDYFPIAQQINRRSIAVLPLGRYHPGHGADAEQPTSFSVNPPPSAESSAR